MKRSKFSEEQIAYALRPAGSNDIAYLSARVLATPA